MIPALKAEFRKLLTVRSTYIISGAGLGLLVLLATYVEGYKAGNIGVAVGGGSTFLAYSLTQHATLLAVVGSLVALLMFTHEYRYNTITYTLMATNNRIKIICAKNITIAAYIFCYALVGALLGLGGMILGLHLAGTHLPHQDISPLTYLGQTLAYCEGWALAALLIGALLRNQLAALATLLLLPNIGEALLSLFMHDNAKYLPFRALQNVLVEPGAHNLPSTLAPADLSPLKGGFVFVAYLIIGWAIAWLLLIYRDAN